MKTTIKRLLFRSWSIFLLFLSSCARMVGPDYDAQLADTEWILFEYGDVEAPTQVVDGTVVTLQFKPDGLVGGSGGCNVFSTKCEVSEGVITFIDIEATLRACQDGELAAQEKAYFDALSQANRYERSGDVLRIWYGEGQSVLIFDILETP